MITNMATPATPEKLTPVTVTSTPVTANTPAAACNGKGHNLSASGASSSSLASATTASTAPIIANAGSSGLLSTPPPSPLSTATASTAALQFAATPSAAAGGASTRHGDFNNGSALPRDTSGGFSAVTPHSSSRRHRDTDAANKSSSSSSSSLSAGIVIALLLVWVHGWVSGMTHEHTASRNFKLVGLIALPAAILSYRNPVGRRVLATGIYALMSGFVMSVTSAIAWYRNPKHAGHLPDVLHDVVPYIDVITLPSFTSWLSADGNPLSIHGLEAAELLMSCLIVSTLIWVLCQPYRWLVFRRSLVVYGTLALWRSCLVIITAIPDASPRCSPGSPGTVHILEMPWRDALSRGVAILVGDITDPCRTAGDMVFSGHSMVVVLCGMIWHTYYRVVPGTFVPNVVKMFVWVVVSVILFLIVVTRLHYTLDVVLALYFAVTIFNAYHRIADDVLIGHRFVAVWLLDGLIIYPTIEWLEAPREGEAARAGMVSRNTRLMNQLAAARQALDAAKIPLAASPSAKTTTKSNSASDGASTNPGFSANATGIASAESATKVSFASAHGLGDGSESTVSTASTTSLPANMRVALPGTQGGVAVDAAVGPAVGLSGILSPQGVAPHIGGHMHYAAAPVGAALAAPQAPLYALGAAPGMAYLGAPLPSGVAVGGTTPPPTMAPGVYDHLHNAPYVSPSMLFTLPRATFGADGGLDFAGYQYITPNPSGRTRSHSSFSHGQIAYGTLPQFPPDLLLAHAATLANLRPGMSDAVPYGLQGSPGSGETGDYTFDAPNAADARGTLRTVSALLSRALATVTGSSRVPPPPPLGPESAAVTDASGTNTPGSLQSHEASPAVNSAAGVDLAHESSPDVAPPLPAVA